MNKRRFRADDPERKTWQDPEEIFTGIGLAAGMTFVDVGCGEGFFALPAARRVGPDGKVFAADINPDAIAALWEQAANEGLSTLSAEVKAAEETVFWKDVQISSSSGSISMILPILDRSFGTRR